MRRSSAGKVYSEKLSTDYNRLLKYTVKQAAEAAIQNKDSPFQRKYLDMTLIHGIAPHRAKLTIARDMLATMWRKGEKYDNEVKIGLSVLWRLRYREFTPVYAVGIDHDMLPCA